MMSQDLEARNKADEAPTRRHQASRRTFVSVVSPAFDEAENLPLMHERLSGVLSALDVDWEWIVVDDHSADGSFDVMSDIAKRDRHVRAIRFARNFGSHTALTCGIHHAAGDCCIVLAADLQDPPETIPELIEKWRAGARVVWAVRKERRGESSTTIFFSRLFYWLMRHFVGMKEMPATGADFWLMDRAVIDAFNDFRESNVNILALITWIGFRQEAIHYDKEARVHGRSGWILKQKLKLLVDSVTSFSFLPIRIMAYVGFIFALVGFIYAGLVIATALTGEPVQGWASLMVVVLVLGGFQMIMMGVLGEYLWRALDESRRRPRYVIEAEIGEPQGTERT